MRASVPMWRCRYSKRWSGGEAEQEERAETRATARAAADCGARPHRATAIPHGSFSRRNGRRPWLRPAACFSSVTLAAALASASASARPIAAQSPYTERIPGTLIPFEMIPVPGGSIALDVAGEARTVDVTPFWIAKTETTWDLYDIYVYELDRDAPREAGIDAVSRPTRPYVLPGDEFGHEGMPALGMSLHAAREFARWVSVRTGRTYRVPTEAQWAHACRLGAASVDPAAVAWTSADSDYRTHEVGSKAADALGLNDMLGNAAEWVAGIDGDSVAMGGAYDRPLADVNCAARLSQTPAWKATDPQLPKSRWWLTDAPFVGLRLIRVPDDSTETGGTT